MIVRFLGTAAGGGLPQWNCGCPSCQTTRATGAHRTQDTLAVSGDGAAWYLVNASPDLRAQLLAAPELAPPPGTRDTPVRGVLLSTAELDHVLGLPMLREASELAVYTSGTVLTALHNVRSVLAAYTEVHWHRLDEGQPVALAGGLEVRRWTVGSKRPRYATDAGDGEWVSALDIVDGRGARLLYATCLGEWTDAVAELVDAADCAVLDGTFATGTELVDVTGRSSSAMGHLPIEHSLAAVRSRTTRILYSHLNNTNPLAGAGPGAGKLDGVEIAVDGLTLVL